MPTNNALIQASNFIRSSLDKGNKVIGMFLDLEKALNKLEHCGIRGITNSLFSSCLSDRTQVVKIDKYISSPISVN